MNKISLTNRFNYSALIAIFFSMLLSGCSNAEEILVSTQEEYEAAVEELNPGDTIILANGVWSDFEILFEGEGTEDNPITLTAEEKGQVIISGQSNLRIAGEYLVVSGLVFKDGYTPTDSVISYRRNSSDLAYNSRVTEVVIDHFNNPERTETDYWVAMYGKHNRFDHNHLEGKSNVGVTFAVRLNSEESIENYHQIDHNYFGPRSILGSNGGETLRIGTSHYSLSDSFTTVENNYFDRCDGELEIISNKSGGNVFKGNVFFESRGTLTMRHGNGNFVEENVFFGNGEDHTGGIRVINADQTIRNNYMEGLAGYRFGGALVIMNGVPNSPINRYHQVENAVIENNSLVNSDHIQLAAGSDPERSALIVDSQFKNNLIYNQDNHDTFTVYDDVSGIEFADNVLNDVSDPQISEGFVSASVEMSRAENGLMYPVSDEFADVGIGRDVQPIQKQETGADWYPKPEKSAKFGAGNLIAVEPGHGTLAEAVKSASAGDTLVLPAGDYVVSRILEIQVPISIISERYAALSEEPVRDLADAAPSKIIYERGALFEIQDGGSLHLNGLTISGEETPDSAGNMVIRTQRSSMLNNYELIIDDCDIVDLDINHTFNFLVAAKSTLADKIEIVNSRFSDITGSILKLDAEIDDFGRYNAEYVDIFNSSFNNVEGALISFYRGGTDESTFGPHFHMAGVELNSVGHGSRNKTESSILLHGVQATKIDQNQIAGSKPISIVHTVGEPVTYIHDNQFVETSEPTVFEMNSDEENTAHIYDNTFN